MFGALTGLHRRIRAFARDTRGYAVMSTLAIFLFLFVLCAAVYAIGETIRERVKMQNACDAAAYSAAVVQADGLSRMACINRAMSWTYVQMTNRQMDYITYRWLKLTSKRFGEDAENAEHYAEHMTIAVDRQLGWWALLEAAVSAIVDILCEFPCDTGNHAKSHRGLSWWCGQEHGDKLLEYNGISLPEVTTQESMQKFLSWFKFIDDGDPGDPGAWGRTLGELIDYDKSNIKHMNAALRNVNSKMAVSMRETAQNVLKTSLKDSRLNAADALSDYYVTLRIPLAKDPYELDSDEHLDGRVNSFFSPLRNTEADERLFLQMNLKTADRTADKPLSACFPVLLVGNSSTAYGLDQWFVRGKGTYVDYDNVLNDDDDQMCRYGEPEAWEVPPAMKTWNKGQSGWLNKGNGEQNGLSARLTGTVRSEGELGIQRAYKDTNLNEGRDGFSVAKKFLKHRVDRGNHLMNSFDLLHSGYDAFMNFIAGSGGLSSDEDGKSADGDDDDGLESVERLSPEEIRKRAEAENSSLQTQIRELEDEVDSMESALNALREDEPDYADKKEELTRKIQQKNARRQELEDKLASNREGQSDWGDQGKHTDREASAAGKEPESSGVGELLSDLFMTILDKLAGMLVDIEPSCRHVHASQGFSPPMCRKAAERTSLYSQYRWASCKWYCMTKGMTWLYSIIFNHRKIWCDRSRKTFKKFAFFKIRGSGYGHFGFPKWFCGNEPSMAAKSPIPGLDEVLKYFPPLPGISESVTGSHGYMKTAWDLGNFQLPISPLWHGRNAFARDEFCSCAGFPDGTFRFATGSSSWAGLIRGHARIYGDDKEIFDNRYVGARCQPWVLNEKFFSGDGTIVVGAAKRFTNPFSHLFGFLQQEKDVPSATVLSAFDIPRDNYMWTMSAARAAVRHRRRNGAFDGPRQYQVTYDPTSDTENLAYNGGFVIHDANADAWTPDLIGWESQYNGGRPVATRGRNLMHPAIFDGCVCHERNERRFVRTWNLCESDWDATLLPLRFCGERATLRLRMDGSGAPVAFMEQDYDRRQRLLYQAETCNRIIGVDDVLGAGTNWVWDSAIKLSSSSESSNPFVNAVWRRASDDYFGIPTDLNSETLKHGVQLKNKLPGESDGKTTARFWELLQWNRVL